MLTCKYCGSSNVTVQAVEKTEKRGCLSVLLWIIIAFCTCGLALLFPLLSKKGSTTHTLIVCQNCGSRYEI